MTSIYLYLSIYLSIYPFKLQDFTTTSNFQARHLHCKKCQVVSTNYYLVASSTEILHSVNF